MRTVLLSAACLGVAAWGFQAGLSSIGVDHPKFEQAVRSATRGDSMLYPAGIAGRGAVEKFKALSPEARAALVSEALRAAKTLISTAAFAKAHEQYLADELHAVNHGGAVTTDIAKKIEADPEAGLKDMMTVAAAQMGQALRQQSNQTALKMMLDMDLRDGDAKLKKIAPLLSSNFDEFRKQYSLWKCAKMGGPATEEAYQAALKQAGVLSSQQDKEHEQRKWDDNNLKAVLRKRLDQFIATAATVDFAAQTKQEGGMLRFVNPAYERKPSDWKLMYRAGRAPVQTALDFARAWRKEL